MSRLKYAFHMRYDDIEIYKIILKNTPREHFKGWERIARGNRVSTEGFLFWLWMLWSYQLEEIGRINRLYVEWRFTNVKLPWPYGTLNIPVGVLGMSKLKSSIINLNEKNATI